MRIVFDPIAAEVLLNQIDYLVIEGASQAAQRLAARAQAFLKNFLSQHSRAGKHISVKDIWEIWIPGTRLIVWYRFTERELQIVRIWHSSQDR